VQVLGLDPAVLSELSRWDRTVGGSDPGRVRSLLGSTTVSPGIPLDDGATSLAVPVRSWVRSAPGAVDVTAWVSSPTGEETGLPLTLTSTALTAVLPPGRGRTLAALAMTENPEDAARRQHHIGEGGVVEAVPSGTLVLGTPSPGASWATWSSRTSHVSPNTGTLRIGYELTGTVVVVRPGLVDRAPVPVVVDEATAARGPALRLDLGGGDAVAAQVVGTLPRFPTTGPRFVVADRAALGAALDDHEPGSGAPREIWADAGTDSGLAAQLSARLAAAPWDQTVVALRDTREAALATDPVAEGAGGLLLLAAGMALLVALVSLVLLVLGEGRDDEGQLLAQEADGVTTTTLRRSLWWRAVAAAVPALVVGTVAGLVLTRAVTTLLALSATGATPTPPLDPAVGPAWTGAALLAGLAVALLACAAVTGRMLRGTWPGRPEQDLR